MLALQVRRDLRTEGEGRSGARLRPPRPDPEPGSPGRARLPEKSGGGGGDTAPPEPFPEATGCPRRRSTPRGGRRRRQAAPTRLDRLPWPQSTGFLLGRAHPPSCWCQLGFLQSPKTLKAGSSRPGCPHPLLCAAVARPPHPPTWQQLGGRRSRTRRAFPAGPGLMRDKSAGPKCTTKCKNLYFGTPRAYTAPVTDQWVGRCSPTFPATTVSVLVPAAAPRSGKAPGPAQPSWPAWRWTPRRSPWS